MSASVSSAAPTTNCVACPIAPCVDPRFSWSIHAIGAIMSRWYSFILLSFCMCCIVVVSRFTDSLVPSRCAASTMCCSVPGITLRCMYPLNPYVLRILSTTLTMRSVVFEPVPATPELRNSPSTVCLSTRSLKVFASSSTLNPNLFLGTQWLFGQKWQSILQKSVNITCMRFVNLPFGSFDL